MLDKFVGWKSFLMFSYYLFLIKLSTPCPLLSISEQILSLSFILFCQQFFRFFLHSDFLTFAQSQITLHGYEAFSGIPKQSHDSLCSKWTISYHCGESCSSNISNSLMGGYKTEKTQFIIEMK